MPRRGLPFRRSADRRERRERVLADLGERYRLMPREQDDGVEIHFPRAVGRRAAKSEVVAELERIDSGWSKLFVVYPREAGLRQAERRS
jgi:hypothetical protein